MSRVLVAIWTIRPILEISDGSNQDLVEYSPCHPELVWIDSGQKDRKKQDMEAS